MEMNHKIKEIADKIHREGVEKANREAGQIVGEAKQEAERIIADARRQAEEILRDAKTQEEDFSEKIRSEIRIAHRQAMAGLKKEITDLIQAGVIGESVRTGLEDHTFVLKLLESVVENWKNHASDPELEVLLPADQLENTEKQFRNKVNGLLNNSLVFTPVPGLSSGFEIRPQNGGYKISMTDEALEEFLRSHFRPRTAEFLFGGEEK